MKILGEPVPNCLHYGVPGPFNDKNHTTWKQLFSCAKQFASRTLNIGRRGHRREGRIRGNAHRGQHGQDATRPGLGRLAFLYTMCMLAVELLYHGQTSRAIWWESWH